MIVAFNSIPTNGSKDIITWSQELSIFLESIGIGIVEQDLSSDGYIRFENGLQFAWKNTTETAGGTEWNTTTKLWYSSHSLGDWKKPFAFLVLAIPSVRSLSMWATQAGTSLTSAGTVRVYRPNNATEQTIITSLAIGNWK